MTEQQTTFLDQRTAFQCIVGSRLYGTETPTSDTDTMGIYFPTPDFVFGIAGQYPQHLGYTSEKDYLDVSVVSKRPDGKNAEDAEDIKYYELRNFVDLALKQGPNIVEILYVAGSKVLFKDPRIQPLFDLRDSIVSDVAIKRFVGYANAQKHKMVIRTTHFKELTEAMEFFDSIPEAEQGKLLWEITAAEGKTAETFAPWLQVNASHFSVGDLNFKKALKVKSMRKIVRERLDGATNRTDLMQTFGFDTKFGSHLVRLMVEGKALFTTGEITFPLPEADLIRSIKMGEYTRDEVIAMADDLQREMENSVSVLRPLPDYAAVNQTVMQIIRDTVDV